MRRILYNLFLILLASPLAAFSLDDAEQSILKGKAAEVIPLLEGYSPKTETETLRRMWILGVAYNRSGKSHQAVAPLARLVILRPDDPTFRLELANALVKSDQIERARYHLELAKGAGLSPPVQAKVQAELDRLAKPKKWQGYFRFAIVPESNAARRTSAETVNLSGFVLRLAPNSRAQSATAFEIGTGVATVPRLTDALRARFALDLDARLFDGRAPDEVTLRTSASLLHFADEGRLVSAEIYGSQRWIDDAAYAHTYGLGLSYTRNLGTRARATAVLQRERITYDGSGVGVNRTAGAAQFAYAASSQLVFRVGMRAENRASSYSPVAGHAAGVTIGGDYSFAGGLRVGLDLSFDRNEFDGVHPIFGVARVDKKSSVMLNLSNQNWSYKGFTQVLRLGFEEQRSTISINRFRNATASIGLTRSF